MAATSKRLLLRGAEILLSKSRISVSPVTRCLLKTPLIYPEEQVFLKVDELSALERLIENGVEIVMDVDPADKLKPKPASGKGPFVYTLQIRNDAAGYKKDFHFYQAAAESATQYQADFVRWDAFKPTWGLKVSPGFFVKLRAIFTDPWFAGHGHSSRIARSDNDTLRVEVGRDALRIFFNSVEDQPATIGFDDPPAEWSDPAPTTYLSKDLAPILFNLADAAVSGDVEIAGNEHALGFRYENEIGKYEIAVPTLVDAEQRKRDAALFIGFGKPQP